MSAPRSGLEYTSRSITVHQRQSSAPTYSSTGRSSRAASANTSRLHGCQLTGWRAALARYGVAVWSMRLTRAPRSVAQASASGTRSKEEYGRADMDSREGMYIPCEWCTRSPRQVREPLVAHEAAERHAPGRPRRSSSSLARGASRDPVSAAISRADTLTERVLCFPPMTTPVTTITPKVNGPLRVEGPVRLLAPDGTEIPVPPRKDGTPAQVVVLCRCGASATKPFCDGSHKRIGFDSSV